MTDARVLYVSQTGMTEALGQSQVIAYLELLTARGFAFDVLSMEPPATTPAQIDQMRKRLERAGIAWTPLHRTSSHRLARKVYESSTLFARAISRAARRRPHIVHARSHFPGAVADAVSTLVPGAKFLFDVRGMTGEQYVDAGHWTKDRIEYRLLKAWERRAFSAADGVVVLTNALERWLMENRLVPAGTPRAVIPCCVDEQRFRPDPEARLRLREELGIGDRLLVAHAGGLGLWYLEEEMAAYLGHLRKHRPDTAVLVMSKSKHDNFARLLTAAGFTERDVFFRNVPHADMHRMLPAADVGLAFIIPTFGMIGASPTKVPEYFAAGLVTVANDNVGDIADIARESPSTVLVKDLTEPSLAEAAAATAKLLARARSAIIADARDVVDRRFSLANVGIPRYEALYRDMLADT